MALQALATSKMFFVTGIMTIRTGRNDILFTGRMFCMTLRTGKILKMSTAIICIVLYNVSMAGRTEFGFNGCVPVVASGLMRLMTEQTILEPHFRGMLFMAVKACLILSRCQAMSVMTLGTILCAMSTGQCS